MRPGLTSDQRSSQANFFPAQVQKLTDRVALETVIAVLEYSFFRLLRASQPRGSTAKYLTGLPQIPAYGFFAPGSSI